MPCVKNLPTKMPRKPPKTETRTDSVRNWKKICAGDAPTALRVPTSRTRSLNEASWMFMTTMPPTSSEMIPQIMNVMSYILLFCSLRRRLATREKTSKSFMPCSRSRMRSISSTASSLRFTSFMRTCMNEILPLLQRLALARDIVVIGM